MTTGIVNVNLLLINISTLRPKQNGRQFPDDIFKCILLNENMIPFNFSLKFISKGPENNIAVLIQIMAWRRPGDKLLPEPMVPNLLTHICVTRPQWVRGVKRQLRFVCFNTYSIDLIHWESCDYRDVTSMITTFKAKHYDTLLIISEKYLHHWFG